MQSIADEAMPTGPARRRRVPALAPEERRAALIAATVPLLREHGMLVTTRQIAEAAGVAEGTIFGVFPDKPSLIRAAVLSAFDPEPLERALSAIDPRRDLRARLTDAARILQSRFSENGKLLGLMRSTAKADDDPGELHRRMGEAQCRVIAAVAKVIEPDQARLRVQHGTAAHLFVSLIVAVGRHGFAPPGTPPEGVPEVRPLDGEQIVSLLLDGLLVGKEPAVDAFDQIMSAALDEALNEELGRSPGSRPSDAITGDPA